MMSCILYTGREALGQVGHKQQQIWKDCEQGTCGLHTHTTASLSACWKLQLLCKRISWDEETDAPAPKALAANSSELKPGGILALLMGNDECSGRMLLCCSALRRLNESNTSHSSMAPPSWSCTHR